MKTNLAARIALLLLLVAGLTANLGCDTARGGAEICLEGVSTGALSMTGKTITGLPSEKLNVVLKVSAKKVNISTSGSDTVIKLSPSGATIVVGPDGITISGVEPDQIEMKWQDTE